jgi:alpha-tubulin suppressor-like RCC1 family protein
MWRDRAWSVIVVALGTAPIVTACDGDPVAPPPGGRACALKSISTRRIHTYGVSPDGDLWGWGLFASYVGVRHEHVRWSKEIVSVATRSDVICETHTSGTVLCWPDFEGGNGALELIDVRKVAMSLGDSNSSSCFVRADGTVGCWSFNATIPFGTSPDGLGGDVVDLALGAPTTRQGCAVKRDRSLWCWGAGMLGDGSPARVTASPALEIVALRGKADKVALGKDSTCVITTEGQVVCWGPIIDAAHPALGPTPIELDTPATQIAMGQAHACALTVGEQVWCWGSNDFGQLGPAGETGPTPRQVPIAGDGVVELSAGWDHSCARKSDGTTWCWGSNTSGQLGDIKATTQPVVLAGCP